MRQRVVTASALALITLLPVACAYFWPIFIFALLLAYLGHREISRLVTGRVYPGPVVGALILVTAFAMYAVRRRWFIEALYPPAYFAVWLALIGILPAVRTRANARTYGFLEAEMASVVWLIIPLMGLLWLHQVPDRTATFNLQNPIWMAIVPVWAGDIAAILMGRKFGRHLMAPSVSPKKTWEGAAASLVASVICAAGLGRMIGLPLGISIACGAAVGTLGQLGDLYESYLKRQAGVKDSGTLLPGHGGLMDRIDSLLFAAPAVAVIIFTYTG